MPGDHDMCVLGSPEFQIECFGVDVGEFDAGVEGEGVVGHVEGDLGQNVEAILKNFLWPPGRPPVNRQSPDW